MIDAKSVDDRRMFCILTHVLICVLMCPYMCECRVRRMLDLYRTVFRSGQLTSIIFILKHADCLPSQTSLNSQALNDPSTFRFLNHIEGYYNYTVWGLGRCSFGFRIQGVGEGGEFDSRGFTYSVRACMMHGV